MQKILMYGKGWATVAGYILMAVGYVCTGFGLEEAGKPLESLGLVIGGFGTVRKRVAGL